MKKNYIQPATLAVALHTEGTLLTTSGGSTPYTVDRSKTTDVVFSEKQMSDEIWGSEE